MQNTKVVLSDGKDSWDPEATDVLFDAIRDDPRWKAKNYWRDA